MSSSKEIQRKVASCRLAIWTVVLLCLLVPGAPLTADSNSEEALRARVEQLYNALQQGDWQKAEKYLTKESRPAFRNQAKRPLIGYQIQSIKIDPDGKTASVVIEVPIFSAATPRPILLPRPTQWRWVNHAWYMVISAPNPSGQQSVFGMGPKTTNPNPSSVFSNDLKFEATWRGLGNVKNNEIKVARFPFTNISAHVVTLADIQLGCDCLSLKTRQMQYKPGESGTLDIEFDPSKLGFNTEQSFLQDIIFRTEPSGAYVKLTVAALLLAPNPAPNP